MIRWTVTGTATTWAGPADHEIRRVDGTTKAVIPGSAVTVGPEPVLIG